MGQHKLRPEQLLILWQRYFMYSDWFLSNLDPCNAHAQGFSLDLYIFLTLSRLYINHYSKLLEVLHVCDHVQTEHQLNIK